jgi:hypothetical protein
MNNPGTGRSRGQPNLRNCYSSIHINLSSKCTLNTPCLSNSAQKLVKIQGTKQKSLCTLSSNLVRNGNVDSWCGFVVQLCSYNGQPSKFLLNLCGLGPHSMFHPVSSTWHPMCTVRWILWHEIDLIHQQTVWTTPLLVSTLRIPLTCMTDCMSGKKVFHSWELITYRILFTNHFWRSQ